jgi:hypothetical protein
MVWGHDGGNTRPDGDSTVGPFSLDLITRYIRGVLASLGRKDDVGVDGRRVPHEQPERLAR